MMPDGEPALERRAAARQLAVVVRGLGEAHRDAGADRGRQADQEGLPGVAGGEGGGEDRRQRRDRAVHQPGEARLHLGQDELAPLGRGLLVAARRSAQVLGPSRAASDLVRRSRPPRDRRAACASRRRWCAWPPRRRSARPAASICLGLARAPARGRAAGPASRACARSSRAHARGGSAGCARRSALRCSSISAARCSSSSSAISSKTAAEADNASAQPVGIGPVDARVVLLGGDRERQDLLFRQRIEGAAAEAEDAGKHEQYHSSLE